MNFYVRNFMTHKCFKQISENRSGIILIAKRFYNCFIVPILIEQFVNFMTRNQKEKKIGFGKFNLIKNCYSTKQSLYKKPLCSEERIPQMSYVQNVSCKKFKKINIDFKIFQTNQNCDTKQKNINIFLSLLQKLTHKKINKKE